MKLEESKVHGQFHRQTKHPIRPGESNTTIEFKEIGPEQMVGVVLNEECAAFLSQATKDFRQVVIPHLICHPIYVYRIFHKHGRREITHGWAATKKEGLEPIVAHMTGPTGRSGLALDEALPCLTNEEAV